jgi:hypothetical protein
VCAAMPAPTSSMARDVIARPPLASFARTFLAALAALLVALAVDRLAGSAVLGSAAGAVVLAGAFAWRPIEGLLAFGMSALLVDTVEWWAGSDVRYLDEAAIPMLLTVALAVHRDRLEVARPGLREAGLALFFAAALASTVVQGVPFGVWAPGLVLLAKAFAFFYLVVSLRFEAGDAHRAMIAVLGFGMAITAVGLAEFLAPDAVRGLFLLPDLALQRGDLTIVTSVFLHPALYGWLTAFVSLFLYARFAVDRAPWALPLALLANAGTLLSGRRTPLLGVLAGLAAGAARQLRVARESARTWLAVGAVLVLVGVVTLPFLSVQVRDTLTDYVAPPAMIEEILGPDPDPVALQRMQPRIALYLGSLAIGRDELPLGKGIGRFGSHMSREEYSPVYAEYGMDRMYGIAPRWPIAVTDAFWPMILGEAGLLGLVGAAIFFGVLGRDVWRAAALPGRVTVRVLLLGALLVYVEALVRSLTSSVFIAPPIAYWVFGTIGLALSVARRAVAPATDPS